MPPVLLLTGPAGVGKREMAHWLSQWLLCETSGFAKAAAADAEPDEGPGLFGEAPAAPLSLANPDAKRASSGSLVPCGTCASCLRAVRGNWVDFTEISSVDEDGASGALKIDQFRDLKARLGFGAFDGPFRIILIRDADRLTVQAANSLLKVLEEPPPRWIFFLTASDASLLLPTLVSRCQTMRLRPFPVRTLEKLLEAEGVPADRRSVCAELAQGSWARARSFAEDAAWERRKDVYRFVSNPSRELGAVIEWAAADASSFDFLLTHLEQASSELIRWAAAPATAVPGVSLEDRRILKEHAQEMSRKLGSSERAREFWTRQAERVFRARTLAHTPLNRKIAVQNLLMPWL